MTGSQKFNHIVGQVVGSVLQFFGALYLVSALIIGATVLAIGAYRVLIGWYTEFGPTSETIFLILTSSIGILFFIIIFAETFYLALQKRSKQMEGSLGKEQQEEE